VTEEFNLGYSWAITPNSVFEAEYTHVLGLHENKTMNIDQKVPVDGVCCTRPLDPYFTAYNAANPTSPLSELASVRDEQSIGRSHYDGYNFSYHQRLTHHVSINANYTLAWAYSYGAGGGSFRNYPYLSTAPFASYDWGPSPNDERHHITVSGTYDMPWGLQLSPILQFGSARPYPITNSYNTLNTGGGTATSVLVPTDDITNYLYGTNYIAAFVPAYVAANPTDPTASADGKAQAEQNLQMCFYGNCAAQLGVPLKPLTIAKYDPLRGDPFFQLDLRLAKNFKLGEHVNLQLVAQAFNLTNRANYGNDYGTAANGGAATIASPTFGHPLGFINPSSTTIPRSLWSEFGFRLTF